MDRTGVAIDVGMVVLQRYAHLVQDRKCLRCGTMFQSLGPQNRICLPCKKKIKDNDTRLWAKTGTTFGLLERSRTMHLVEPIRRTLVMNPKIDPEFKDLIPVLSNDERALLEENLVKDGCRDPLVVWAGENILLDGHTRLEICTRRGIEFKVVEIELPDREAAADWIDANQLGRRNLTRDQASLLRGRRYNRAKKAAHDGGKGQKRSGDQNDTHSEPTAEHLAKQHGVSAPTIKRDGKFAAAVEKVKAVDPEIEKKIVSGTSPPKAAVVEAAKLVEKEPEAAKAVLVSRKPKTAAKAHKSKPVIRGSWKNTRDLSSALREMQQAADFIIDLHPEKTTTSTITSMARAIIKTLERFIVNVEKE